MINQKSVHAVSQSSFSTNFVKPLYDSYCFSNIPSTITNILLDEKNHALPDDVLDRSQPIEKVVLLLVDGFGWEFVERFTPKYSILQKLIDGGVVSKLTTQFPSTTSAALTTLYSAQSVGEHGSYEWNYYEPKLDAIISPILFSFAGKQAGNQVLNTLVSTSITPEELFPNVTLANRLEKHRIPSYAFVNKDYLNSPFGSAMFQGASGFGFSSFEEGCINLRQRLLDDKGKGYYFIYYENIDKMCHKFGPNSAEFETAVEEFCVIMETALMQPLAGRLNNTLLMMTADHGQVTINPDKTIYLNKQFPHMVPWFKTNTKGESLVPAGGCRDMFLHIKEAYLDKAERFLKGNLHDLCEVYRTEELIAEGFFGPTVSETFRARVGNLVLLPTTDASIWWYEKGRFEVPYKGHHGGLSRSEGETILACHTF